MATYYKIGTGAWNVAGSWSNSSGGASNGAVPDATTDCIIDANSGSFTVDGVLATPSLCRSAVFTGYASTMTMGSTAYLKVGDGTAGAFTLVSGMTFSPNAASTIEFVSTTTGNNITWGGKTLGNVIFNGVGGVWTAQDTIRVATTSTMTLTNGHFDTNSQTVTTCVNFSSDNSNTRALTLGTTTWNFPVGNNWSWNIATSTGMTLSAASSTLALAASSNSGTFAGGGLTYGTLTQTALTTGVTTFTGANTFATLTLSNGAGTTGSYQFGANQTVTGTWTGAGNSVINRLYYRSNVKGTARTLSAATWTLTNIDLQDTVGAGAGNKDLSAVSGLSGDCGGNSGWTLTTGASQYWVSSAGTSTGSESAVTRWANSSGGTAGTGRSPLPQDTAVFDANSIDAGSRTITQDKPRIGPHIWTGATNTPAWTKSTVCAFFGEITMIAGMTNSGTQAYTYEGRSSSALTTAGQTLTNALAVDAVNAIGTLTQGDATAVSSTLTVTSGTLTQSQALTGVTNLTMSGGTLTIDRDLTISGTQTLQSGTVNGAFTIGGGTGITFSGTGTTLTSTATIFSGTTITVNGSGSTYNVKTVTGTGSLTFTTGTVNLYASGSFTANSATAATLTAPAAGGGGGGTGSLFSSPIIRAA